MNIKELESHDLANAVKFNDKLNPRLWDDGENMRPEVREKLLAIAEDFREYLGVDDIGLKDITVSGSNAAYSYTPESDIDLHLIVDMPERDNEVYKELFDAKKYAYNDQHNFTIGGYPVELYVQDAGEPHYSQGIYSILNDKWVDVPKRRSIDIDDVSVSSKYDHLENRIKSAIDSEDLDTIEKVYSQIKKMRQSGLRQHGEFGPENITFKILRKNNLIKDLIDARNRAKDQMMSLAERNKQKPVHKYGFKSEDVTSTWDGVSSTTNNFLNEKEQQSKIREKLNKFKQFIKHFKCPTVSESKRITVHSEEYVNAWEKHASQKILKYIWDTNNFLSECNIDPIDFYGDTVDNTIKYLIVSERNKKFNPKKLTESQEESKDIIKKLMSFYGSQTVPPQINSPTNIVEFTVIPSGHRIEINIRKDVTIVEIHSGMYLTSDGDFGKLGVMDIAGKITYTIFSNDDVDPGKIWLALASDNEEDGHYLDGWKINYSDQPNSKLFHKMFEQKYGPILEDVTSTWDGVSQTTNNFLNEETVDIKELAIDFIKFCRSELKIEKLPKIIFKRSPTWSSENKTFGHYNNSENQLVVGLRNRHPMDIMRTLAHELVHHRQYEMGEVPMDAGKDGSKWENQANSVAGVIMRRYGKKHPEIFNSGIISEASGYIPTAAQAHDPRFEMALTCDVHPGTLGKVANAFRLVTDSQGHPQLANPNGTFKLSESKLHETLDRKLEVHSVEGLKNYFNMQPDVLSGHTNVMTTSDMMDKGIYVVRYLDKNRMIQYHIINMTLNPGERYSGNSVGQSGSECLNIIFNDAKHYLNHSHSYPVKIFAPTSRIGTYLKMAKYLITKLKPGLTISEPVQEKGPDGNINDSFIIEYPTVKNEGIVSSIKKYQNNVDSLFESLDRDVEYSTDKNMVDRFHDKNEKYVYKPFTNIVQSETMKDKDLFLVRGKNKKDKTIEYHLYNPNHSNGKLLSDEDWDNNSLRDALIYIIKEVPYYIERGSQIKFMTDNQGLYDQFLRLANALVRRLNKTDGKWSYEVVEIGQSQSIDGETMNSIVVRSEPGKSKLESLSENIVDEAISKTGEYGRVMDTVYHSVSDAVKQLIHDVPTMDEAGVDKVSKILYNIIAEELSDNLVREFDTPVIFDNNLKYSGQYNNDGTITINGKYIESISKVIVETLLDWDDKLTNYDNGKYTVDLSGIQDTDKLVKYVASVSPMKFKSLVETYIHELVHYEQHNRIAKDRSKVTPNDYRSYLQKNQAEFARAVERLETDEDWRAYLSSPQEITAHAHDLANRLIQGALMDEKLDDIDVSEIPFTVKALKNTLKDASNYQSQAKYKQYDRFDRDNNNHRKVINRFLKTVYAEVTGAIDQLTSRLSNDTMLSETPTVAQLQKPSNLWKARVRIKQPNYIGWLEVTVAAANMRDARNLIKGMYGVQEYEIGSTTKVK